MPRKKQVFGIEESEFIAICSIALFSGVWAIFILPWLTASGIFLGLNPVFQYILFNLGFITLTIVIFGGIFAFAQKKTDHFTAMFRAGIATWLGFSFILDLWQPPFYLSSAGQALITQGAALPQTSVDAMMVYIWGLVGATGFSLYLMVYFMTPIVATVVMAILLSPEKFFNFIGLKN